MRARAESRAYVAERQRDLQYVHINETPVGALVGCDLYVVAGGRLSDPVLPLSIPTVKETVWKNSSSR